MILGTTYIYVSDIKKSINFYSKLLQEQPLKANDDRWVQFSNKIALYIQERLGVLAAARGSALLTITIPRACHPPEALSQSETPLPLRQICFTHHL